MDFFEKGIFQVVFLLACFLLYFLVVVFYLFYLSIDLLLAFSCVFC